MEKNKIEELKEKLYRAIENHGRDSPEVLIISQKLDMYIVKEMKRINEMRLDILLKK
ncbi:aspartyl-phosphate phosphatase Spo0E family protein [Clostridium sp.]|uniref:aspartyl-phosphate phosphatase Spo0E family protein n=1 Tax=Clostridium sp. TaxID=1506 RepID=UPI002622E202|nr:aspartyl-phosphate phosphatase Spo0E family protein [Clostridium sp.]